MAVFLFVLLPLLLLPLLLSVLLLLLKMYLFLFHEIRISEQKGIKTKDREWIRKRERPREEATNETCMTAFLHVISSAGHSDLLLSLSSSSSPLPSSLSLLLLILITVYFFPSLSVCGGRRFLSNWQRRFESARHCRLKLSCGLGNWITAEQIWPRRTCGTEKVPSSSSASFSSSSASFSSSSYTCSSTCSSSARIFQLRFEIAGRTNSHPEAEIARLDPRSNLMDPVEIIYR